MPRRSSNRLRTLAGTRAALCCMMVGLACGGRAPGPLADAGPGDSGTVDAGEDAGVARSDAGRADSGAPDAGMDAGSDAGVDAGPPDAGPPDAGTCGDDVVNVSEGEQCDLGAANGAPDSGCSATCQLLAGLYRMEAEPNDTQGMANNLDGYAGVVGQLEPASDVDWYSLSVTIPSSSIFAEIGDGLGGCPAGFDSRLSLYSGTVLLVTDTDSGVAPCSLLSGHIDLAAGNLPTGSYTLEVSRLSPVAQPFYVLTARAVPPSCGDGVLEAGEECDPGSVVVPACSATCQLTGDFIPETEPNDSQALANPLGTHAGFIAAIRPVGDIDYFSFTVPGPASSVTIETSDGIGGCPLGFSSLLHFYDPSGTLLATDADGGVGLCSLISPAKYPQAMNLPGGTYRTRVEFNGDQGTTPLYVVTIAVQ
jgi:cysteine-rich repeat protein